MDVNKQEMISFLRDHYHGDVQARGIWLWAGGDAKDVSYSEKPEKRWDQLWALAEEKEKEIAPQNLIQEALLDTPGDKFLIDCLNSFSKTTSDTIKNDAKLLSEILEHWGEGLEFDSILSSLLIFSDCSVRDGLTVLIPNFNKKLDEKLCDKWEPWFQKIKKEKYIGSVGGIFCLLDLMLDSLMKNSPRIDLGRFHVNAAKVKAYLEKELKGFEDIPKDDQPNGSKIKLEELIMVKPKDQAFLENLVKELAPLIGTFVEINAKTLKPNSLAAFTGIQKVFELSKTISSEKKWPLLQESAETCFKSIWAIKAKKTEYETIKDS